MEKFFTHADALKIQANHLEGWRKKLSPACFEALEKKVASENKNLPADPYDVFRGDKLTTFIQNWKP